MSISGRVPLLVVVGIGALVVRPEPSTGWLWLFGVAALTFLDLALAPATSRIGLDRRRSGSVRLGEATSTLLEVSNNSGRRVVLEIRDAWQPSAGATGERQRLSLAAADRRLLRTELLPVRRGDLVAHGVTVRCWGPLRLAARQRTYDVPGTVRALPPFASRKHLPSRLARLRELDGRTAVRVRGQGTEFDSLREYVRGDDVRSIDWRASARSPHVVVRTWQPERDRRVVLVLDTSRTAAGRVDDVPRLDSAMDAALLLASLAARAGDRVDFLAGDVQVRSRQRLAGARDVAGRLQDAMAPLTGELVEADWDTLASAVQAFGKQRALVVLLTPLEPSAVTESLLPVLPALLAHHRVVLASVRDPELARMAKGRGNVAAVYDAAAAETEIRRRTRTAEVLRSMGVDVLDADAESLPPKLADHYLALKAQGLL